MRKLLLIAWLLVPVGALAYHLGPGQDRVRLDDAAALLDDAARTVARAERTAAAQGDLAAVGDWTRAEELYEQALGLLPADRVHARCVVRLERAKCQMLISELPQANADLVGLVDELTADESADPELVADARRALAGSQYYMTWLLRLEGAAREQWEPRIEASRQTYKLLAEEAERAGDAELLAKSRADLEASIRLARMDLTELQGLPLPSQ